jgi:putative DNA primase/helicase
MATGKEKPGGAGTQPGGDGTASIDGFTDRPHDTTLGPKTQPPSFGGLAPSFTGPAIWRNQDHDEPVTVTGYAGLDADGGDFFTIAGSTTAIPGAELIPPHDGAGSDLDDLAALVASAIVTVPSGNGTTPHDLAQPVKTPAQATPQPQRPEHFTDLGNTYRLIRQYGDDLRHVTGWGWLTWDGRRWQRDDKPAYVMSKAVALGLYGDAQDLLGQARKHLETAQRAAELGDGKAEAIAQDRAKDLQGRAAALASWAKASQSRGKIEAAVKLAESEPSVSATSEDFDADPWLLNCANGTIDLRTGELRPHTRGDLLTRLAPVPYDPTAICPTWDAFLTHIMGGNADMLGFLQRAVGYSLTGSVQEQCLFFPYGGGANGKSTFLKAILSMLGRDYAKQAAPELLTVGQDRHPTELADLAGVRFVASIEVAEGKRLAEALVKQLTGGDPVKARLMRQDFFQFDPAFKIWLAANHKPVVKGTDFAIWRRIRLIPFTVTIPEAEQDKRLGDKLHAELAGILAWAVRGCLAWQRDGLGVPATVTAATEAYRAESDELAGFLEERIDLEERGQEQAGPLYRAYHDWAEANGLKDKDILTNVKFGRQLTERGFDKYKDPSTKTYFYTGLTLRK